MACRGGSTGASLGDERPPLLPVSTSPPACALSTCQGWSLSPPYLCFHSPAQRCPFLSPPYLCFHRPAQRCCTGHASPAPATPTTAFKQTAKLSCPAPYPPDPLTAPLSPPACHLPLLRARTQYPRGGRACPPVRSGPSFLFPYTLHSPPHLTSPAVCKLFLLPSACQLPPAVNPPSFPFRLPTSPCFKPSFLPFQAANFPLLKTLLPSLPGCQLPPALNPASFPFRLPTSPSARSSPTPAW